MADTDNSGFLEWLEGVLAPEGNFGDRAQMLDALDESSPNPAELYSVPVQTHDREGRTLDINANPGIPHGVEFKPIEVDPELRRQQALIKRSIQQQQLQNVAGNTPEEWVGQNLMAQNYVPNPEAINQAMAVASRDDSSLARNAVKDGTAVARNLRTYAEMQRAARMKAEADAFAAYEGLLGSEETAPHRGLATLLGETLGFKGNTWSQDFRDATHMDEPVMQKILAGLRGMGRRPSQFGDTALTELVGGFNIAEDRAIAGATAGQTAGLEAFKAETDRLTALKGDPPSGPQLKLIQDTGHQLHLANRLRDLQNILYRNKGGTTGGGTRGIGHIVGDIARWVGADPGESEEVVYDQMRAGIHTLMTQSGIYDERWNKQQVKNLIDKTLPPTGWKKSESELEHAVGTLLSFMENRTRFGTQLMDQLGLSRFSDIARESAATGNDFPGLVSVDGVPYK
tara:strand:- start:3982 stop:5349 length:1368 start_codon:yes stop_codon:yes gene_type:complete